MYYIVELVLQIQPIAWKQWAAYTARDILYTLASALVQGH